MNRQEALRYLSRSPDICPRLVHAVLYMNKSLALQGGNEQGATLFERVAQVDPEEPSSHYQLAELHRRLNRTVEWREQSAIAGKLINHAK